MIAAFRDSKTLSVFVRNGSPANFGVSVVIVQPSVSGCLSAFVTPPLDAITTVTIPTLSILYSIDILPLHTYTSCQPAASGLRIRHIVIMNVDVMIDTT
jgi:hypothetical protein